MSDARDNAFEDNVTGKLYRIFEGLNLDVTEQHKLPKGRIDLRVKFDTYTVAIECELYGSGKRRQAVNDACSRLFPTQVTDIAIAVVYPNGCTVENLNQRSKLNYSIITYKTAKQIYHDEQEYKKLKAQNLKPKRNENVEWYECTVKELANIVKKLKKDLGEPDRIVDELKNILDVAVERMSDKQLEKISKSLDLPPEEYIVEKIDKKTRKKSKKITHRWKLPAKRALLVVASASLFHARLDNTLKNMKPKIDARTGKSFKGRWPPNKLLHNHDKDTFKNTLNRSWNLILAVDYKPIFETGRYVLSSSDGRQFDDQVKEVTKWAYKTSSVVEGLRQDILGRIFHKILQDARYDGSYYTSVASSVLLAGLTIRDKKDLPTPVKTMKIIDPACGTGTLLIAITERIRDVLGKKYNSKIMIENVLTGIDINNTALHIAATTLGLLSPTTFFSQMDIGKVDFGQGKGNEISAGSLEFFTDEGIMLQQELHKRTARQIESNKASRRYGNSADLVIMNPPFTRSDLRHKQLDNKVAELIKSREEDIFRNLDENIRPNRSNSGLMFLMLGEKLVKGKNSVLSFVFPTAFATAPSAKNTRRFLASKFHIEYIIVPHDPKHSSFSENTDISELLFIMRRRTSKNKLSPTKVVSLAINPDTAIDANNMAKVIRQNHRSKYVHIQNVSKSEIESGNWFAVQFFSPFLVNTYRSIRGEKLFETKLFKDIANIRTGGRDVRDVFLTSQTPDIHARRSVYEHKSDQIVSIKSKPYVYLIPKIGKKKTANNTWDKRSFLLLPERFRTNLTHVTAIYSSTASIGTAWNNASPKAKEFGNGLNESLWSKDMTVYLNSTLGIITMLGCRIPKALSYPRYGIENYEEIRIPTKITEQTGCFKDLFDEYGSKKIGSWKNSDDPTRIALDKGVALFLGLKEEDVEKIRIELSREPMCLDKRYDE